MKIHPDGQIITVGDQTIVWLYELYIGQDQHVPIAEVWLADEQAREHYAERYVIRGRLYGRVGSRRRTSENAQLVAQGEHALAAQTLRQAGIEARRVVGGRGWL